jgi:nucleotide-binding universal stress UspA family protein
MSVFTRILFAADLSESSKRAFGIGCSLTHQEKTRMRVLHVVEPVLMAESPGSPGGAGFPVILPTHTPEQRTELETELRATYTAPPNVEIEYLIRYGAAPEQILHAADEFDADLIVMGTHGRTGLDRLLGGSVAEAVLRRSRRPVLTLRSLAEEHATSELKVILHPTDFSERAKAALRVARLLAQAHGARLFLLHVVPAHLISGEAFFAPTETDHEQSELEELKAQIEGRDLKQPIEIMVSRGDVANEIVRVAGEANADLIALGTHGRTGLARFVMGSVAELVMRKAPCAALVVKAQHDEHVPQA